MRIRYPFAGAFAGILLLSAYFGLLPHSEPGKETIPPSLQPNDKFLHFISFFALSMAFYWIFDTTRRRTLQLSLIICTMTLGLGSEVAQALLPNDRAFDPFDVVANVVGSLGAISLCTWYHKRMIERRRKARFGTLLEEAHEDVELGLNSTNGENDLGRQETGVTPARTLEQEVDNWDENAVDDWDEDEDGEPTAHSGGADRKPARSASKGNEESREDNKRSD